MYDRKTDGDFLAILLADKTTGKNVQWLTKDYESIGEGCLETDEMTVGKIQENSDHIKPRVYKRKDTQKGRTKAMAEVFTPSWVCNKQDNLIDNKWFGREGVFNQEADKGWITNHERIIFPDGKTWTDYVKSTRLEITCGESPYMVSRYDTTSGETIAVPDRIGFLDRKLRVVRENTDGERDFVRYAFDAFRASHAYEWQGDSLLLARENFLLTFIEHYMYAFGREPDRKDVMDIAHIIAWNVWQMDGLKCVVPLSCHEEVSQTSLFGDEEKTPCKGCSNGNIRGHNGDYCVIMDWENGKPIRFVDLMQKN